MDKFLAFAIGNGKAVAFFTVGTFIGFLAFFLCATILSILAAFGIVGWPIVFVASFGCAIGCGTVNAIFAAVHA